MPSPDDATILPKYEDWKAPKSDGATLIWPEPQTMLDEARSTRELLARADAPAVQGTSLLEHRRAMRAFIGHADDSPLIMTGHQAELHHPGVWAKNALIDAAARSVGGKAFHLAVDTDSPKHLELRWPGYAAPITDDADVTTAEWTGQLVSPSPAHADELIRAARGASQSLGAEPMLVEYLNDLRAASFVGESWPLPNAMTAAMHRLDWSIGLDYAAVTLSPMLISPTWLAFAHHLLANAASFGKAYNTGLAEYRTEQNITGHSRPMPDLVFTAHSIEAPFWLDEVRTGMRHRTTVELRDGKCYLHKPYEDDALELDPAIDAGEAVHRLQRFLAQHELRLAPRALTLTLFMRLFVADLFVHGIGGGRYDQITDRLIRDHFGLVPPPFAVTTATLYLPRAEGRQRACVPCVVQEGHRLKHSLLGDEKKLILRAIESAPRGSRQRLDLFFDMHRKLRTALGMTSVLQDWQSKLDQTKRDADEDAIVFNRELFYAVQPRERLTGLIERYRDAV
ncbi:MAG: hypothetical protein QM770_13395 [Tepidisphaeraceae bacterium]